MPAERCLVNKRKAEALELAKFCADNVNLTDPGHFAAWYSAPSAYATDAD